MDEHSCLKEQLFNNKVRGASGEGFEPAFGKPDFEDRGKAEAVGHHEEEERHQDDTKAAARMIWSSFQLDLALF